MKIKSILLTAIATISLATATMAQVPNYVPTNGLVGWWPFNGNANDESGNGNNGTVNGATLTNDRFGQTNKAYDFNGTNNKITIPHSNSLQLNNGATFSLWARIDTINFDAGSGDFDARLIDKSTPGGNDGYLIDFNHRTTSPNPAYFNLCSQGSSRIRTIIGGSVILTDCLNPYSNWSHLIITFNNGILKSYINGALSDSILISSSSIQQNLNDLVLGYATSGSSNTWLNGQLDDIGIWNRALTQQEITDLYNGCQLSVNTQPTNQTINVNNNAQFVVSSSDPSTTFQWQTDLGVGYQNLNSAGQYTGTTTNTLTVSNVTMSNNNQPFRCIVSSGSCSDTSNVAILTVNNNVSINETTQDNLFSVFPNPAQSIINVKANSKLIGQVYSIYDNTGRVVLTGKLNSENTTIELNNLSGGIYMFSVGENMKQTFKVIKE